MTLLFQLSYSPLVQNILESCSNSNFVIDGCLEVRQYVALRKVLNVFRNSRNMDFPEHFRNNVLTRIRSVYGDIAEIQARQTSNLNDYYRP